MAPARARFCSGISMNLFVDSSRAAPAVPGVCAHARSRSRRFRLVLADNATVASISSSADEPAGKFDCSATGQMTSQARQRTRPRRRNRLRRRPGRSSARFAQVRRRDAERPVPDRAAAGDAGATARAQRRRRRGRQQLRAEAAVVRELLALLLRDELADVVVLQRRVPVLVQRAMLGGAGAAASRPQPSARSTSTPAATAPARGGRVYRAGFRTGCQNEDACARNTPFRHPAASSSQSSRLFGAVLALPLSARAARSVAAGAVVRCHRAPLRPAAEPATGFAGAAGPRPRPRPRRSASAALAAAGRAPPAALAASAAARASSPRGARAQRAPSRVPT